MVKYLRFCTQSKHFSRISMSNVTVLDAPARSFEAAAASACSACTEAFLKFRIRYLLYYCARANYCIKRVWREHAGFRKFSPCSARTWRARASLTALSSINLLSHNSTVASENKKAEALAKNDSAHQRFERRTHTCQAKQQPLHHIE